MPPATCTAVPAVTLDTAARTTENSPPPLTVNAWPPKSKLPLRTSKREAE